MKKFSFLLSSCVMAVACTIGGCTDKPERVEKTWSEQSVENAYNQIKLEIDTIEASGKILNPVTLKKNGEVYYVNYQVGEVADVEVVISSGYKHVDGNVYYKLSDIKNLSISD